MKKTLISFCILLGITLNAQSYFFDRLIQYEENGLNQVQVYFNIENPNYYLLLNNKPGEISAKVYDKITQKVHEFEVEPLQESNGLIYSYKFKETDEMSDEYVSGNAISYDFETTRDDKYYRFGTINIFHEDNSQLPLLSADLTLRYTHEDLFNAFNLCCLLGFNNYQNIKLEDKFVVVKAKVIDQDNFEHVYKLIDDQVIQFKLEVPKDQK